MPMSAGGTDADDADADSGMGMLGDEGGGEGGKGREMQRRGCV